MRRLLLSVCIGALGIASSSRAIACHEGDAAAAYFDQLQSGQRGELRTLTSGRSIRGVEQHLFCFGAGEVVMEFSYLTDHYGDKEELQNEVSEIWSDLRVEIERLHLRHVQVSVIDAHSTPSRGRGAGFSYEKNDRQEWEAYGFVPHPKSRR